MSSDRTVITSHPVWLRLAPLCAGVMSAYAAFFTAHNVVGIWGGVVARSPEYGGSLLALRVVLTLCLAPALCITMALAARSTWFYLFRYSSTDDQLRACDPVLRRCISIQVQDVRRVCTFRVFGVPRRSRGYIGHMLVTTGGETLPLSEALPNWPQIAERLGSIHAEEMKAAWWEPKAR